MARVRIGTGFNYAGDFHEQAKHVAELERAGIEVIALAEAYSFAAVSQVGYLAAKTERVTLSTDIIPFFSRTPSLLAMTAAGLDMVSNGRFQLGIGSSGPQVIEGFHGIPFDAPLGRTREVIEIMRKVWRREDVEFDGKYYHVPLKEGGTGLGKPLHLINHPVRDRVPVYVASLTPKSVEQTAEIAEGWIPVWFSPEHYRKVWGDALDKGLAKRDPELGPLNIKAGGTFYIGPDVEQVLDRARPMSALYIGGMGAKSKNFYNDVVSSYGYEEVAETVQDLYLSGKKKEAEAALPYELLQMVSLVGETEAEVGKKLDQFIAAGVTTLSINVPDPSTMYESVEALRAMLDARGA